MASSSAFVTIDRLSHQVRRSRPLEFVVLFSAIALVSLGLTAQLAVVIGAGSATAVGWVDLNAYGGLLVGGVQGLIQYVVLRSRYRVSVAWIVVTAIAWAIAVSLDWQSLGVAPLLAQGLCSILTFGLVGIMQSLLVFHQCRLRNGWLKVVGVQMFWVGLLQLITLLLLFGLAILALATFGRGGMLLSVLHTGAIGVYNCGLLAHGVFPAFGLYRLCRGG